MEGQCAGHVLGFAFGLSKHHGRPYLGGAGIKIGGTMIYPFPLGGWDKVPGTKKKPFNLEHSL